MCNSYNWAYREWATDTDLFNARQYIIFKHWYENLDMFALRKQSHILQQQGYKGLDKWHKSYHTKLKLNFIKPMHIPTGSCHLSKKKHTSMEFHFWVTSNIVRRFKRGGSHGYHLSDNIYANIASWELIVVDDNLTYLEFEKKFDLRFITKKEIFRTWSNNSPQHGDSFKKTDFKSMSKQGRKLLQSFLTQFESVRVPTLCYKFSMYPSTSTPDLLRENYNPWSEKGRTITIEHHYPNPYILYASEAKMGGKEKAYLIVNENEVLHLEND